MSAFKVGALVLAVVVAGTFLGFTKDVPFVNEPYTIKAAFTDSSGLKPNSPVRIAGVTVGEVREVEHTEPGARAVTVTMAIDDGGRPVHRDASAKIQPRIFLEGNFFIDLSPGTPHAPEMEEGETIPSSRTENPVQLDEVLKALTSDTREDLQRTFAELARTEAAGGGKAFNRSLEHQAEAYRFTSIVNEALLGRRPGDLSRWLNRSGVVAGALVEHPEQLKALLRDFNVTAAAFADRQADLRATLRELPRTLKAALPTYTALNDAFPSVRAFARAAVPGVRSSGPAIDALLPLVRQLRPLVGSGELGGLSSSLRRAIPPLAEVARESVPLLEQQRLLASCATEQLIPFGNLRVPDPDFPAQGPVHQEFPKTLPNLAGESRSFDANGQWFKVLGQGGTETFSLGNGLFGTATQPLLGVRPAKDDTRPPLRPEVPCETQELPDLEARTGAPPPAVPGASMSNPKVRERYEKARETAVLLKKAKLAAQGHDVKVADADLTAGDVKALAGRAGLAEQLAALPKLRSTMKGASR